MTPTGRSRDPDGAAVYPSRCDECTIATATKHIQRRTLSEKYHPSLYLCETCYKHYLTRQAVHAVWQNERWEEVPHAV